MTSGRSISLSSVRRLTSLSNSWPLRNPEASNTCSSTISPQTPCVLFSPLRALVRLIASLLIFSLSSLSEFISFLRMALSWLSLLYVSATCFLNSVICVWSGLIMLSRFCLENSANFSELPSKIFAANCSNSVLISLLCSCIISSLLDACLVSVSNLVSKRALFIRCLLLFSTRSSWRSCNVLCSSCNFS